MAEPLIAVRGLSKSFGGLRATDRVDLDVEDGETHAIIGPNGARETALAVLGGVGLGARADVLAANLAHGEQRQLEIAMALATRPRLLLLDEPVAGMGLEETQRMVRLLSTLKRRVTIVLVEHDMDAVFTLADRISVMVYGRIIATGSPEEVRGNAEVRRAYLGEGTES